MRTAAATCAGRISGALIRLSGRGAGQTLPGTVALRIDPEYLRHRWESLGRPKVILVCGTNGKTTTTSLITEGLKSLNYSVQNNSTGSNLLRGISALFVHISNKMPNGVMVLEVDENALPQVIRRLPVTGIVMLNLFRDQLDRFGELSAITQTWYQVLASTSELLPWVIVNGQDPQLVMLAEQLRDTGFTVSGFGVKPSKKVVNTNDSDNIFCPRCGNRLDYTSRLYSHIGNFTCKKCNLQELVSYITSIDVKALSGDYNRANIAAAGMVIHAIAGEVTDQQFSTAWQAIQPAFGRQERGQWQGAGYEILLVKNPTGFNQALSLVRDTAQVVLGLNDKLADGTDVSWIWDVDFEQYLMGKKVILVGKRRYEMAIRMQVAQVDYSVADSIEQGLLIAAQESNDIQIFPTYTAMLDIRQVITGRRLP
jgi:lipid II isoglutaminyl synthase (glutamine-hydrolysing)